MDDDTPRVVVVLPVDRAGVPITILAYAVRTETFSAPAVAEALRQLADTLEAGQPLVH